MDYNDIISLLSGIIHPETKENLVAAGMVRSAEVKGDDVRIVIALKRVRDPFTAALKREILRLTAERFPQAVVTVFFEEPAPKPRPAPSDHPAGRPEGVGCVIAVASGKGGVGKSTVTAGMAVTLSRMGYRVGILDADIYGPSQAALFSVADYAPPVAKRGETDMMLPAESQGIKIMSIAFFIDPSDALVWRGPMATSALKQLIHQTLWGELDYLLIDLPPGTGDVHLTVLQEIKVSGAVIVTTPQPIALSDVVRGIAMLRAEKIGVPVLGIIENMAWFTPAELPQNRYYIFGKEGAAKLAKKENLPLLGQIPLVLPQNEAFSGGLVHTVDNPQVTESYTNIIQQVIKRLKC